ncbi:MerR family transcriptional regulator [Funiculus sociatus GB2-A5]|uniref:MerR family transcriptional regulator n=1 Tax=Funiculus sociatus GB2-A5 TaxID=2933946 RepID=A0ABV0JI92_9CYAN|nr:MULTISPECIES: MerR family transcriptional regulator [Cyanophyceae]MBD1922557.1 MerR family transcriptional regulator [Microcoleus sp. FACHB-831]MBD2065664.1 MerR family transcriptional regulator [Trichocoleus sp. FACHB-6]
MQPVAMKVGDLAKQTGVSVRTLHYYDEIGLLSPSRRTETGYRLYIEDDIIRLQQIVSLRQIGFSLEQIRECLEQSQFSPHHVVQLHLSKLKEQMELQQQLYARLEAIAAHLQSAETISIEEFIQLIEVTMMVENYYTPEQLDYLQERRQILGEERIRQVEAQWQELIDQARTAMQNDIDPTSEAVQKLARRSQELIQEFTGGDAGIERSLNQMYQQEGVEVASRGAMDSVLMEYMNKARAALKQPE